MYGAADHDVASAVDPEYRSRREQLARAVDGWTHADPLPEIEYTPAERAVWSTVCRRLYTAHAHHAAADYLEGWERLALPTARIPHLADVNARLESASGFRVVPSAGWVPEPAYYAALAEGLFPATLHLRHPEGTDASQDPDLLHSLLGHAVLLASPRFARLHRLTGEAGLRAHTDAGRRALARVFWFTCEVGLVVEHGRLVCVGARLLSSPDSMQAFRTADVRPLDLAAMARGEGGGAALYRADSAEELETTVAAFLDAFDDDVAARLGA